jgi:UDP:flavonoid glycosyltransferase YjiC (YdhE family)
MRILLAWELGAGLGHAMNLRPLAAELAKRRYEMTLAAKDVSQVREIFATTPVTVLQAPWNTDPCNRVDSILTFADLLWNIGFGDRQALVGHVAAWRNLFALVKPDLVVCDHSPTALLAARDAKFPVATVGTGFFCPIDETPLRLLRNVPAEMVPTVRAREQRLVETMNWVLDELGIASGEKRASFETTSIEVSAGVDGMSNQATPLTAGPSPARGEGRKPTNIPSDGSGTQSDRSLRDPRSLPHHRPSSPLHFTRATQLYHNGHTKHFLLTYPELDHFGANRAGGDYCGVYPYGLGGQPFVRPSAGPCLFAYLKPFPALPELMQLLANSKIAATVYVDGWRQKHWAQFQTDRLRFASGPVDIRQAAEGCDAALTNANHSTCVAMLLAGKPLIHVPPYLEQALFAAATDRLGVSLTANLNDANGIFQAIEQVLAEPRFTAAARQFADRHVNDSQDESIRRLVDDLELLVASK